MGALQRDLAGGSYAHVCDEIFSAEVRSQAGGPECPAFLRRTAGGVRQPRIVLERIVVSGQTATARVRTSARGQAPVSESLQLVRQRGRFRISSLSR